MMNKTIFLLFSLIFTFNGVSQKVYKTMMNDMSINFYDVCDSADKYFETHDKTIKGSGWKGYQRWRNANEYKYAPSGRRDNIDPQFTEKAYKSFIDKNQTVGTKSLFNNGWNELGPFTIDSITGGYAPGLGRIEDVFVSKTNANLMYIGTRSGGFWKSTDGGDHWDPKTDFIIATGVNTIAVSPTNTDSVIINIQNSRNNYSHGLYRSTNGGNSFSISNFNPTNIGFGGLGETFKIYTVKYHPTIANLIFIGTNKGLYISNDNLATWTRTYNNSSISEIHFHPTDNDIIYMYDKYLSTNRNYLLRSIDQGLSFTKSSIITGNSNNSSVRLSVSNACEDCIFFASTNGVWKSIDKGINFTFMANPNENCGGFVVNDTDINYMIYGYVDIEASSNGGATFERITRWSLGNTNGAGAGHQNSFHTSTDYVHPDLHPAICVNGIFYIGTDGMLAKSSDNGTNWEIIGQGIANKEFYKLGVSQSNHYRAVAGSQDNGSSIQYKDFWIDFYGADGMEGLIHPLNDDYIISSLQYGSRRRTTNGGLTQGGINAPGQNGYGNSAWVAPIAYDPNNHLTIYNFSEKVYKSDDFGSNWSLMGDPPINGTIKKAAIAENNSDIIIVSSYSSIFKSTDQGVTYTSIKNNLPSHSITDIAFDPKNDNNIIVVNATYQNNNQKIYFSTNQGASWTNITHNLGDLPIHSVVIDHTDNSNIYIGTEIGVYTMPLNGNNWVLFNPNLPNCSVLELEIVYGSNSLKAATWGRGMWEYSLKDRNNYPAIVKTHISNQPTNNVPLEGFNQFVTSEISYDNNLSSVYIEWSIDNPTFGNIITMSNTVDSTWISDTHLPNYPVGTKLFFKVFAIGIDIDTTETYKFMYTVKPFEYCDASGTMNFEGNITLVDFESINNATGKTQPFTDYSTTDSATIIQTQAYELTVNLKTDNGNHKYYAKAWIDWNRNTEFENSESYLLGFAQNVTDGPTNLSPFTIVVPEGALVGETRMRISCKYNSYPSSCDQGVDGEVEDYKIIIEAKPDLSFVTDKTVLCNTGESINFSYNGATMDSVRWFFTNGTNIYTSNDLTGDLTINHFGTFDLHLNAYLNDFIFESDVSDVFIVQSLNVTTTATNSSILAEPAGYTYQWIDCNNDNNYINNENSQIFNAVQNGNYAVEVFDGNCTDTSTCVQLNSVGIIENDFGQDIQVYPNPTNSTLSVHFNNKLDNITYVIVNNIGQSLKSETFSNTKVFKIDLNTFSKGIYVLHLNTNNKKAIIKIIKE